MLIPGFKGRVHPAGWPFIGISAAVTLILWPISVSACWVGLLITNWCAFF